MPADPPDEHPEPSLDWFGRPLRAPRHSVPCPRCGATFTDADMYRSHQRTEHGEPARNASDRGRRARLSTSLRRTPLVLVVTLNVAVALLALGMLSTLDPPWWHELQERPYGQIVIVPLLWPTIAFLLARGFD